MATASSSPSAQAAGASDLLALCAGVLPVWLRHLASVQAQSQTAVAEMMQAFAAIAPHAQAPALAAEVERMYVGFQYQDRLGQMVALLEADMARLQAALVASGAQEVGVEAWLARLRSEYVMAEQHQEHGAVADMDKPADGNSETTFF